MLCSVYTTIAGEYCDPPFCTPIDRNIPYYCVLEFKFTILLTSIDL